MEQDELHRGRSKTSDAPKQADVFPVIPGYAMKQVIGQGGFGLVYAGTTEGTGRQVAVKVARTDVALAKTQLHREIAALERIGPPAVPAVWTSGSLDSGTAYVVMEYVAWPTLDHLIEGHRNGMTIDHFGRIALAILDAVAAVHRAGMCHADLKPPNIFIQGEPPAAKLIDFGLTRMDRVSPRAGATLIQHVAGTAEYMSPEQCERMAGIDLRSDVYSLGVVFYEMVTGRTPFAGTPAELHQAHRNHRPRRPSQLGSTPEAIEEVIMRCLAKESGQRFSDAMELRAELGAALVRARRARGPATAAGGPSTEREAEFIPGGAADRPAIRSVAGPASSTSMVRDRRLMVHLFFDAEAEIGAIQSVLNELGGHLAHVSGTRGCAVFDPDSGKEPISRPLRAAQALTSNHICSHVVLDIGQVTVRRRKNGQLRYRSPLFSRRDHYPHKSDPAGILIANQVADTAPDVDVEPVPIRDGLLLCRHGSAPWTHSSDVRTSTSKLVGRRRAVDALVRDARAAIGDRVPSLATVIADAGHGKSHLCATLHSQLATALPGVELLDLRAPEPIGGDASGALRALLLRVASVRGHDDADALRAQLSARLGDKLAAESWPAVAWVLGAISRDDPEFRRLAAVPRALHDSLVRAVGGILVSLAAAHPTCLVIDDAQFADEATLDALEYATRSPGDLPLWICVLARPNFETMRPEWGQQCSRAYRLRLPPLDKDDAANLCRQLLYPAENVPNAAIDRLVARTRGIPMLLVELIRGLKREGLVRKHDKGDMWFVATDKLDIVPDMPLVEWLAERELRTLPDDLANHTRLLALLRADFDTDEVEGILREIDREGLAESFPLAKEAFIGQLVASRLLIHRSEGRVGFRHALLRDNIAASVPRDLAKRIHRAAYNFYHSTDAVTEEVRLARLAFHAAESGRGEDACTAYLALAQRAAHGHAYLRAEQLFSRLLDLVADTDLSRRFAATKGRGAMRYRIGRYQDSLADLEVARELARTLGGDAEIHVLLDEATVLDWTNEYRKSERLVYEARRLAQKVTSELVEARLLMGTGRSHFRFCRLDEARASLEAAADLAERLGDDGYETLVISLLLSTLVLPMQNAIEATERAFTRLIPLCEERGDRMHLAVALTNRRVLCIARDNVDQAVLDGQRGIDLGRELGILELEYACEYNLGELLYLAGDVDAAWPHVRRAVELESRRPSGAGRPLAELLKARVLSFEERLAEMRVVVDRLRDQQAAAERDGLMEAVFLPSEKLLFAMVDLTDRDTDPAEWQAMRDRAKRVAVEQEHIEVIEMYGLWLCRRGLAGAAEPVFAEALDVAQRVPNVMTRRLRRHFRAGAAEPAQPGATASSQSGRLRPAAPPQR
ncbi:MAG: protein kinase [Proteobacteria bacterium]|nr:protein kinase [Pseudomonadota bacterium]